MSRTKYEAVYKETYNEVPAGGTNGQVLKKVSDTNYDTEWQTVTGTGSNFNDLLDTPNDYTGEAGKIATVNSTEDGIEFTSVESGGGGLTETLTAGENINGGKFVKVIDDEIYERKLASGTDYFNGVAQEFSTGGDYVCTSVKISDTEMLYAYNDSGNTQGFGAGQLVVNVLTFNPTTKTLVKEIGIPITTAGSSISLVRMSDNRYIVTTESSMGCFIKLLSISGTTISIVNSTTISGELTNFSVVRITDEIFIYTGKNTSYVLNFGVGNITGDVVSKGGKIPATTTSLSQTKIVRINDDKAMISGLSGGIVYCSGIDITSPTTATQGAEYPVIESINGNGQLVSLNENHALIVSYLSATADKLFYTMVYFDKDTNTITKSVNIGEFDVPGYASYDYDNVYVKFSGNTIGIPVAHNNNYAYNINVITYDEDAFIPFKVISEMNTSLFKDISSSDIICLENLGDDLVIIAISGTTYYTVSALKNYEPIRKGSKYGVVSESVLDGNDVDVSILGVE
jgi:hypothetical protein